MKELERFAQIVLARRTELGLTQAEVEENGGPTDTTIGKIENQDWKPGNKSTLRKLDRGLQWTEGSALRTLSGGDPTPIEKVDKRRTFGPAVRDLSVPRYQNDPLSNRAEGRIRSAIRLLDGASDALTNYAHRDAIANLDSATVVIRGAIETIENLADEGGHHDQSQESTPTPSSTPAKGEKNGAGNPRDGGTDPEPTVVLGDDPKVRGAINRWGDRANRAGRDNEGLEGEG